MATSRTLHPDDVRMTFGEHLEELRKRLIHALIGVTMVCIVTLYYGRDAIGFMAKSLFQTLSEEGLLQNLVTLSPAAAFTIYFKTSLVGAVVLASPWVVYQVWRFVSAGLYVHERKVIYILAPLSTAMTAIGLLFMYMVMLPISLAFLITFAVGYGPPGKGDPGVLSKLSEVAAEFGRGESAEFDTGEQGLSSPDDPETDVVILPRYKHDPENPKDGQIWFDLSSNKLKVRRQHRTLVARLGVNTMVNPMFELSQYINFVLLMTLGIVIGFQMPVILLVGGWTQVLDPHLLARYRKYCVFVCFVLGALLTPADPISMLVLAMPLWMLFELGLLLASLVYKRPEKTQE